MIDRGLANIIYYPLTNTIWTAFPNDGTGKTLTTQSNKIDYWKLREHEKPKYIENTHIELLVAKSFIQLNRIQRIMIVSSPYHMRRVKLIADRLFNREMDIFYSSPGNYTSGLTWALNWREVQWTCKEAIKICWFIFYWQFLPVD